MSATGKNGLYAGGLVEVKRLEFAKATIAQSICEVMVILGSIFEWYL
jgi:hypothetical protein